MKLSKISKSIVNHEYEIIQHIVYGLPGHLSKECIWNIAVAIYLKRREDITLEDNGD